MLCHLTEKRCSNSFIRLITLNVDHQQQFTKEYIIRKFASNQKPVMATPLYKPVLKPGVVYFCNWEDASLGIEHLSFMMALSN